MVHNNYSYYLHLVEGVADNHSVFALSNLWDVFPLDNFYMLEVVDMLTVESEVPHFYFSLIQ